MYRGHEYTAERVSDLAPRETLEYVHAQLGRTSRGHLYLPWIQVKKTSPSDEQGRSQQHDSSLELQLRELPGPWSNV